MMEEDPTSRLVSRRIKAPERRLAVLKVLAGPEPGQLVRLQPGAMTIGRGKNNDLVLKDAQVSRSHARLDYSEESGVLLTDLRSTNGTTVEGEAITARVLKDGEQIALGDSVVLRFSYLDVLEEQAERALFERANPEPLSVGRPEYLEHLRREFAASPPVTVALLGLDGFKELNERKGHPAGDALLRELVPRIRAVLRSRDLVGRYAGDEFGLVLPELTLADARAQLERIRLAISRRPFKVAGEVDLTISVGAAQSGLHGKTPEAVLEAAALALNQARGAGGDRVVAGPAAGASSSAPARPAGASSCAPGAPLRARQQRHSTRVACNIAVHYRHGGATATARVLDIGLKGMRLAILERLPVGTRLSVAPEAGQMEPITVEVLWCRKRRSQDVLEIGVSYPEPEEKLAQSWVRVAMKRLGFGPIPVNERRRSVRLEAGCQVSLVHGPLRFPARLVNLSAQGAAVDSAEPLTSGAPVKLVGLPGGGDLEGKVIYCRPHASGGAFRCGLGLLREVSEELLNRFLPD